VQSGYVEIEVKCIAGKDKPPQENSLNLSV